ncbi:MAG: cupredoxin domain-containing protein [Chloroflexi bacterium]|nr:cupredoxin domain-containing protein [Chloroflexota bacterium]MBI3734164.1 cupredoxin domain-containing protein [Chloroflexota bacterium]
MFKTFTLFKIAALAAVALVAALVMTGCGSTAAEASTTVRVTEDEYTIKLSAASVPAGKVTFDVRNTGKLEHELVLLKTDLGPTALKMRAAESKVDEEAGAANVGEIEDIADGASKSETFTLKPGKYVLVCNVVDHYKAGMAVAFEVK